MNHGKAALLVGILTLLFTLTGGIRYRNLEEQYMDRIRLDEKLSMAAQDAAASATEYVDSEMELRPENVWEHFLISCKAMGMEGMPECFLAAVLTTSGGIYRYDRYQGWQEMQFWEPDRIRQITVWLQQCLEQDSHLASGVVDYEFRMPYTEQEEWARTPGANCLIVLYEASGKGRTDTGYLRLAVGGGQCRKKTLWYLQQSKEGVRYYHRPGCGQIDPEAGAEVWYRPEECAGQGAWPCPECLLEEKGEKNGTCL